MHVMSSTVRHFLLYFSQLKIDKNVGFYKGVLLNNKNQRSFIFCVLIETLPWLVSTSASVRGYRAANQFLFCCFNLFWCVNFGYDV